MSDDKREEIDEAAGLYVISVAAELSGLHPQTLRQYDRMGLVSPDRTVGRNRRYSLRDICGQAGRSAGQAAAAQHGACLLGLAAMLAHLGELLAVDQRAELGGRIKGIADLDGGGALDQAFDELVVDIALNQQARAGIAALPVEAEDHERNRVERAFEVGIIEDDHRALAAELEMHPLQARRSLRHDA